LELAVGLGEIFGGGPMPVEWSNSEEGEPAFRFIGGVLEIEVGDHRMSIVGWPEPRAQEVREGWRHWRDFSPKFRLVAPYRPLKKKVVSRQVKRDAASGQLGFDFGGEAKPRRKAEDEALTPAQLRTRAFHGFRFSLPKEVARVLEKFRSHQWAPLLLMCYDPGATELMMRNPVLGLALAHKMNGDAALMASLQVGTMRQRDILGLLDLPEAPSVARWMSKIPPESATVESLRWALALLRTGDADLKKSLSHLPVRNMGVMRLLSEERLREAVSMSLLSEVAESKRENYEAHTAARIEQLHELRRQAGDAGQLPGPLSSQAALDEAVGEAEQAWLGHQQPQRNAAARRVSEATRGVAARADFPAPPVPGLAGKIQPITSMRELTIEGEQQDNCVASYADRVRAGTTYIYRVTFPQRCTLSLGKAGDGVWRLSELEVSENRPANGSTRDFVDEWLARYRISA